MGKLLKQSKVLEINLFMAAELTANFMSIDIEALEIEAYQSRPDVFFVFVIVSKSLCSKLSHYNNKYYLTVYDG